MSRFEDLRAALEERIAREQAALGFVARLERFVGALEDDGFGVMVDLPQMFGDELHVSLQVLCPAGVVGESVVEPLVETVVEPTPEIEPEPEVAPEVAPATTPADVPQAHEPDRGGARVAEPPRAVSKGDRWSEDEDSQLIEMIARGCAVQEAARRLGRPVEGTRYRCRTVLSDRISKAKAKARKAAVTASVAAPKPAPDAVPEVATAPVAEVAQNVPAPREVGAVHLERSPIAGMHGADVSMSQLRAHFDWLYGGVPDADVLRRDLELVEMICRGDGAGAVAKQFGWTKDQVLDRWCALRGAVALTLRLQEMILKALREMAQQVAA